MDKLTDDWRYTLIGKRDWILENSLIHNPEDDMIAAIDNKYSLNEPCEEDPLDLHLHLERLPERYYSILWSYYFEGKTMRAIGWERQVSKQYIHQEIKQGHKLLKEMIENGS